MTAERGTEIMARRSKALSFPMHTPSDWTFWLSVALVVLAIVSLYVFIPFVSAHAFWIAVIGYLVLVIGVRVRTT
jgi:hypothetical protein